MPPTFGSSLRLCNLSPIRDDLATKRVFVSKINSSDRCYGLSASSSTVVDVDTGQSSSVVNAVESRYHR